MMKNVFFHVEVLGDAKVLFSVFPQSVPSRRRGVIDLAAWNIGDNDSTSWSVTMPGPWGDRLELS